MTPEERPEHPPARQALAPDFYRAAHGLVMLLQLQEGDAWPESGMDVATFYLAPAIAARLAGSPEDFTANVAMATIYVARDLAPELRPAAAKPLVEALAAQLRAVLAEHWPTLTRFARRGAAWA